MKKIENSFAVTGRICRDAEIRSFETARLTAIGEETSYVSAFMGIEARCV